jgi:hypothetical protein
MKMNRAMGDEPYWQGGAMRKRSLLRNCVNPQA